MNENDKTQWAQFKEAYQLIEEKDDAKRLTLILSLFGKYFELVQGVAFKRNNTIYEQVATYAFLVEEELSFKEGEGIIGQAVKNKQFVYLPDMNESYFTITSGLGNSNRLNLLILPLLNQGQVEIVLEMAFFKPLSTELIKQMQELETYYFIK